MNLNPKFIVFVLGLIYLISSKLTFWAEPMRILTGTNLALYLSVPVATLFSVILFGTNLIERLDKVMRIISSITLLFALLLSSYLISKPGEMGLGFVGVVYIPVLTLGVNLFIYLIFYAIQKNKNT